MPGLFAVVDLLLDVLLAFNPWACSYQLPSQHRRGQLSQAINGPSGKCRQTSRKSHSKASGELCTMYCGGAHRSQAPRAPGNWLDPQLLQSKTSSLTPVARENSRHCLTHL